MERRRDVRGSEHACEGEEVRFERECKQPWRGLCMRGDVLCMYRKKIARCARGCARENLKICLRL
eukprot:6375149-Prymnesium_polylepis.1